jgi:hypothetical protein
MRIITINGIDYDIDTLSDETRGQVRSIQFIDDELEKLNAKIAVMSTARMSYAATLQEILDAEAGPIPIEDGSEACTDL